MTEKPKGQRVILSQNTLKRLSKYAQPFERPTAVIDRILDIIEQSKTKAEKPKSQNARKTKKTKPSKYDYDEDVQRV